MAHNLPAAPRRLGSALAVLAALTALALAQAPVRKPARITGADPQKRLAGYETLQRMKADSPSKDLAWQFLGPTNISGRITDVAVVPPKGKAYTIYAGAASGGVWKTDNEGTTWAPVFDQGPSAAVGTLALDPSDPQVLYVGTGEANIFRSSQSGTGVYKTADGGRTWIHLGLAATQTIARIVAHPTDGKTIYVAASGREWTAHPERGIYKTVDGGATWANILCVDDGTGAIDLRMDPEDPQTLYAATWQRTRLKWNDPRNTPASSGSGVWKTVDGGVSWKPINAGLPEARYRGRIGLDVCLSKPDVLYAFVDNYEKSRDPSEDERLDVYGLPSAGIIKGATVYRSDDKGATWRQVSGLTPEQKSFMERHSNTYGWVFGQIRVDPSDAETVYTMGIPLCVSNDGGRTFRVLDGPGGDHHALWIDPANGAYMVKGFDQGVAVTYDRGRSWRYFQSQIPVAQFFNIAYDMAAPFKVYGSMQDHGSFRAPVDLSRGRGRIPAQEFQDAPGGEGSHHAVDPGNPNIVFSAGFYGTIARTEYDKPGRAPGRPFSKSLLPKAAEGEAPLRGQWLAPFILSPHDPATIYHGMQLVLRSRDRGDTWERISSDLSAFTAAERGDIPYHTIFALAESPLREGLLYAGTDDGRAWVTRDDGKNWSEITAGLPYQKWISRMVPSGFEEAVVYMTQNGKRDDDIAPYVWKSADYGRTWISIAANIPLGPINVIREDPVDRNILYLGTDGGAFVTTDRGRTWSTLGGGLPFVYVHDLIVHPRDNIIVIATHGRGMWALDADPINGKGRRTPPGSGD